MTGYEINEIFAETNGSYLASAIVSFRLFLEHLYFMALGVSLSLSIILFAIYFYLNQKTKRQYKIWFAKLNAGKKGKIHHILYNAHE